MTLRTRCLALAALLPFAMTAFGQQPPPAQQKEPPKKEEPKKEEEEKSPYKKYDEVVTKKAVSQNGLFKVHRIEDKVYFEIPESMLGRELLWQTEIAEIPANSGYIGMGMGTKVICFERRGKKVFMRECDYSQRAVGDDGTKLGVKQSSVQPILMAWNVETEGKTEDGKTTAVIDVTQLYTSDPPDFSVRGAFGGGGVDANRSYIDRVKAFPTNIETRSWLTFTGGGRQGGFNPFGGMGGARNASTALIHYSLVLLPEKPMVGRYKDSRIGYFTVGFDEYGRPENKAVAREYITRFRLEKKDPSAPLSEPVKPIVFYVSREVPAKWREAIKQGVEDWKPAFEQAGFKNAIIAKDAPTREQDPDWDPEDARYSVIRWAPSPIQNAMGPSIQDPRSGETISAHIIFWNNITELVENWYFAQAAAIDPAARKLPMPDPLMKELIRYVSAHEVGHTLGLEHNMKASPAYTVRQLRDPKFTSEFGVSPSIMDYSRFNYVAQPGDGVKRTIGMVGPYDKFAIEYGYKVFEGVDDPEDEKRVLDAILARQVTDPRLRFGNYRYSQDPTTQSEDIGDDAIEAGRLGLLNIDRIANQYLWDATVKFGEDYSRLAAMRSELIGQRMTEVFHAMRLVGGVTEIDYHAGRGGDVFVPVPAERQQLAVRFLVERGLEMPKALYSPRVMNKIAPNGIVSEVTAPARMILTSLLSESRMQRIQDNQAANGAKAYSIEHLVDDVFGGLFKSLDAPSPTIDVYHRNLQRTFLETVDRRVNGASASKTDLKPLAKQALKGVAQKIDKALPRTKDKLTKLHLQETRKDIEKIINGKYATASGGATEMPFFMFFNDGKHNCWARGHNDHDLILEMERLKK